MTRRSVAGVVFLATAFVVAEWSRLTLPLGRSHDGFNTAVWMNGGREIIERGPGRSRLGATTQLFGTYAHHPPGLYVIGAAVYLVGGTRPVFARLPAIASVLAGLVLAWALLRTLGRSRLACFGAISLAVTAPMLLLWGPMLNHEAIAMPWAFGALLIAARVHRGRWVAVPVAAAVAFGGAILSWQGGLLLLLLAGTALVPAWRPPDPHGRRVLLALGAATLVAVALTVAWQIWAYGNLRDAIDAFRFRMNGDANQSHGFVVSQLQFGYEGFPLWTVLLTAYGAFLVWRDRASAVTCGALFAAVALYALVFRNGATIHSYWNFWLVFVVIVCVAAVIDRHAPRGERGRTALTVFVVVMVAAFATVIPTKGEDGILTGARAGDVVVHTPIPVAQTRYYVFGDLDEPPPWIRYEVQREVVILGDPADVVRLAAGEPAAVVLIQRSYIDGLRAGAFDALAPVAIVRRDPYESTDLADLAAVLG